MSKKTIINPFFGTKQKNYWDFQSEDCIPVLMGFIDEERMNKQFSDFTGEELENKKQELRMMVGNTIKRIKKFNKKKLSTEQKFQLLNSELSLFSDTA